VLVLNAVKLVIIVCSTFQRLSKLLKSLEFDSPGPQMKKSYKSWLVSLLK